MPDAKLKLHRLFFTMFIGFFSLTALIIGYWSISTFYAGKRYFLFEGIYEKPLNPLIIGIGMVVVTAFFLYLNKVFIGWKDHRHHYFLVGTMITIFTLQIVFMSIFHVEPKLWDFETIYHSAINLAIHGQLSDKHLYYYGQYTNNMGVTLFLACVFKAAFFLGIHQPQLVGLLINIVMIDLAILFLYLTARLIFGLKQASLMLVLCFLFSPYITYVPIYYSDTLSLPMASGMFYLYALSRRKPGTPKLLLLSLASIIGVAGTIIKPTVAILFMALLIHLLMTEKLKASIPQAAVMIAVLVIGQYAYTASIDASRILPSPFKQTGFPSTHWVMMGLKEPYGFYNPEDVLFTDSFDTKAEQRAANIKVIKERIRDYGVTGLAQLLANKTIFIWGDGTYFAPVKLNRGVPEYTELHNKILPMQEDKNKGYIYFCQIIQSCLVFFLLLSGTSQWKAKRITFISAAAIAIFGLGLFLLIWEARSRYLIQFSPFILLCGLDGLLRLSRMSPFWKKQLFRES